MAKHIVLGNQQLLVNIDKWLQVRDIYYPHVGQYNHLLGHAHKISISEHNQTSLLNHEPWKRDIQYKKNSLTTENIARNDHMQLTIHFQENVHCEKNIFFRKITLKNTSPEKRFIRVCYLQDFHLYGDGIGDTAFYQPEIQAIIHYKRSVYFLTSFCNEKNQGTLSDFDIGSHTEIGWNLPKNLIAQGNINSTLAIDLNLDPQNETSFCYYLIAGETLNEIYEENNDFLSKGYKRYFTHFKKCEKDWLKKIKPETKILEKKLENHYKRSLLIIKTQIDKQGAILAANDSDNVEFNKDTYSYMWPRDASHVAITLIKAGYPELAKNFFEFTKDILYEKGCLLHKYNPDRTLGSSWHPWVLDGNFSLPIQEDETALVLHALRIYVEETDDKKYIKDRYKNLIQPMGKFLSEYRYDNGLPKESYDLWEERRAIFTYTTATVLAGLLAAEKLGSIVQDKEFCETCLTGFDIIKNAMIEHLYNEEKGYFIRSVSFEKGKIIHDLAMDSSIYSLSEFNIFPPEDERLISTMNRMKEWLSVKTNIGGIARYYNDHYHQVSKDLHHVPGNPWFICTLWYAKWLIKKSNSKKELKKVLELLTWVADHSLSTGVLAEQIHPYSGKPLSVSPLTWSHSEFVDTMTNYISKMKSLKK